MSKFNDMNLPGFDNTIIMVAGSLYVKTEKAMAALVTRLSKIGYGIKDVEDRVNYKFATLSNIRKGKCGSCEELISVMGIASHGHKCEKCGEVTHWDIVDGTVVRFSFIQRDEERAGGMIDIKMTAKRWDTDAGYVYFRKQPEGGLWTNDESAQAYLEANSDKWEEVEEDGETLIKMRHTHPWDYKVCAFNPSEISDPWDGPTKLRNHSIVKVWDGEVYDEWSRDFPLPDSINIYGKWHEPLLAASPTIHETIMSAAGQVSRKDYYYQDGRKALYEQSWQNMSTFIRHFTELDADAFDQAWPRFCHSGPGGIDDLAAWCHPDSIVRDEPNIGNLLVGFSKIGSGQRLAPGEVAAMKKAADDPETFDTFADAMTGGRRKS